MYRGNQWRTDHSPSLRDDDLARQRERERLERERKIRETKQHNEMLGGDRTRTSDYQRRYEDSRRQTRKKYEFKHAKVINPLRKKSSFICPMRFAATLPDVPNDPKLYSYPFDPMRYVVYKPTTLEKNYKHLLLTEQNMGIEIDILNPNTYQVPDEPKELDSDDEALLLDDDDLRFRQIKRRDSIGETWLRKTEYIGFDEVKTPTLYRTSRVETRAPSSPIEDTFENQLKAIEESFEIAKKTDLSVKHPTKPNLTAVETIPILPDFNLWPNVYTQVIFDSDPVPPKLFPGKDGKPFSALNSNEQLEIRRQLGNKPYTGAIITESSGEKTVAYLLPKRKMENLDAPEEKDKSVEEYTNIREYIMDISETEAYFMTIDPNTKTAYFNILGATLRMTKKKSMEEGQEDSINDLPEKVLVEKREFQKGELDERKKRKLQLEDRNESKRSKLE